MIGNEIDHGHLKQGRCQPLEAWRCFNGGTDVCIYDGKVSHFFLKLMLTFCCCCRDIGWETQCAGVLLATGAPGVS